MISGAIKAKKYNIPFVLEANEVSGIENRARKQSLTWLCSAFEKFLFNRCTGIHTVSSYLKNMIVKQDVAENLVHVTPNAIDPDKFCGKKDTERIKKANTRLAINLSLVSPAGLMTGIGSIY